MSGEGAIHRKITVMFVDNTELSYPNSEYTWCIGDNSLQIINRYTSEIVYVYPYHTVKRIHQETIR